MIHSCRCSAAYHGVASMITLSNTHGHGGPPAGAPCCEPRRRGGGGAWRVCWGHVGRRVANPQSWDFVAQSGLKSQDRTLNPHDLRWCLDSRRSRWSCRHAQRRLSAAPTRHSLRCVTVLARYSDE